jgi:methionyl-tRNA formyltransferase
LPRWRGAAPIQAAILHGDLETGATIMVMDPGVDTGPFLSQRSLPISTDDTTASLSEKLASLGAELLIDTLPAYLDGRLAPRPQSPDGATYAPMLKKEDGQLDFTRPAQELARKVRAYYPWPGAFLLWQGQALKIHRAHAEPQLVLELSPGELTRMGQLPAVAVASGLLVLDEVQPPGKRPMPGEVFLNGARGWG